MLHVDKKNIYYFKNGSDWILLGNHSWDELKNLVWCVTKFHEDKIYYNLNE